MEDRRAIADVAIVGGGPAGAAAAISCAMRGLQVALFEREAAGWERPGETLHPGIEPLLEQLGVGSALTRVTGARHPGIWIEWNGPRRFQAFGADNHGPWHGFQVNRAEFDALLLARAQALGVAVHQKIAVRSPLIDDGAVCGVRTNAGPVLARMVIDTSGRSRWLARALGIESRQHSPRLVARYGYAQGRCPERDEAPLLIGSANGWTWTAKVRPNTYQWTHVALDGKRPARGWMPEEFQGLAPLGRARGADVTWRLAMQSAGPGWFMAGDAAALLDPSSSNGVLKALMSGMTAAHLAAAVIRQKAPPVETAHVYQDWLGGWFAADAAKLGGFYRELAGERIDG